jgi:hypothetical protein
MGLIEGEALSGFANGVQAEAVQQQAHEFRMEELRQEQAAWEAKLRLQGLNMMGSQASEPTRPSMALTPAQTR